LYCRRISHFIPESFDKIWIGLRAQFGSGWQWVTNEVVLPDDVTIWKTGAPSRSNTECAYLSAEFEELSVVDGDCNDVFLGICEKKV